jgi:hypothetical protein
VGRAGSSGEQMSATASSTFTISPQAFHAVIFDLDGVVTRTAKSVPKN